MLILHIRQCFKLFDNEKQSGLLCDLPEFNIKPS